ncbi:MAG: hypothetical protein NTX12_00020, partial [Actinobacteria bacterium]|nr:hypothetical protein [Actinomycetota bacterium]
ISKAWPKNPQTLVSLSDIALRISDPALASQLASDAIRMDPLSSKARVLKAIALETQLKFRDAIPYRVSVLKLQPWGTTNMVALIKDYLKIGQQDKALQVQLLIARIEPNGEDANAAAILLRR